MGRELLIQRSALLLWLALPGCARHNGANGADSDADSVARHDADGGRSDAGMSQGGDSQDNSDAAVSDEPAEVSFNAEQWELLRSLSPAELPAPPPDVSNRYADDPQAAVLGQRLFFDAQLSGALLDADNDGGPNALGSRGQIGRVSCAGCHQPASGFLDTRSTFQEISLGTGWTHRRTPSLLDVGQATLVMWGGRHSTLWSQPFGPLENPLEMNSSRLFVAQAIAARYAAEYEAIFGANSLTAFSDPERFPTLSPEVNGCRLTRDEPRPRALPPDPLYECHGVPGDGAEYDALTPDDQTLVTQTVVNAGKALAAYQRQLQCGPSRFDAWVNGDTTALSVSEQRGLLLFIDRGQCVSCHSGPYFSDQAFHNIGFKQEVTREGIFNGNDSGAITDLAAAKSDPLGILGPYSDGDDGRLPETLGTEFRGAFRTPMLRCVGRRPTFMHSGTAPSLESVVALFSRGGDADGFPGRSELEAVEFTPEEIRDLVTFLRSLNGPGPAEELLGPPQ